MEPIDEETIQNERVFTNPHEVAQIAGISRDIAERACIAIQHGHPFRVTEYYLREVIGIPADPNNPLIKTVFPDKFDMDVESYKGHLTSDEDIKAVDSPHFTQKYQGSAIITVTPYCDQKCVHCSRKQSVVEKRPITDEEIEYIFNGLDCKRGDEIFDIIISGGEPFSVSPARFKTIARCKDSLNIKRSRRGIMPMQISIGTRQPVVNPYRIINNEEMIETMQTVCPGMISIHIIHPREITSGFKKVISIFRNMGILCCIQHPIIKAVNDDAKILRELYVNCWQIGIIPKSLFHPIKSGIPPEKCVSFEKTMEIGRELTRIMPGTLMPKIACCSPQRGKSFIDPFHQKKDGNYGYDVENGEVVGLRTKDGRFNQPEGVM